MEEPNKKRLPGRPKGSLNRAPKFTNYKPKRWSPEFDLIVLASFQGMSNEAIGNQFGYTKAHISNILCTEQAQGIRDGLRAKISNLSDTTVTDRMNNISNKALERLETFVNNDQYYQASPFQFIDRAFRAVQIAGQSREKIPEAKIENHTTINNIGGEVLDRIGLALEKSLRVAEIHAGVDIHKNHQLESSERLLKVSNG